MALAGAEDGGELVFAESEDDEGLGHWDGGLDHITRLDTSRMVWWGAQVSVLHFFAPVFLVVVWWVRCLCEGALLHHVLCAIRGRSSSLFCRFLSRTGGWGVGAPVRRPSWCPLLLLAMSFAPLPPLSFPSVFGVLRPLKPLLRFTRFFGLILLMPETR